MGKRIFIVGAGAIGGYVGGHLTRAGADITLIDPWPGHVEYVRAHGLQLSGVTHAERHLRNGLSAATGLYGNRRDLSEGPRWLSIRLGAEAVRVGQALGFSLERMLGMEPETLARAGEGHKDALAEITNLLIEGAKRRSEDQRPSMAQDIAKGRRTETDFINGFVAARGAGIGVLASTHARMNECVKRVERGEVKASPELISGW